ncbi:MAG: hypothetical protein A2X86_11885 [Bdellovibrionales bacterium GWA2_49_15]|nr:MAG: hypothetical protein A2X86_11885 [Bdellovibrionales bacterium GWA2_49_15]HAZ12548.1 hypothetical protein [Bdellovibrionales bacterium]
MKFGVEEEFFLLDRDDYVTGRNQRVFMREAANVLSSKIRERNEIDNLPEKINRDYENGYLSIKFDSTFNTLEIAYPPFENLAPFENLSREIFSKLKLLSETMGLEIVRKGYLPIPVNENSFFKKNNVKKTTERVPAAILPYDQFYHGRSCGTHIHLDFDIDLGFRNLRAYYALEPLLSMLYSNSQRSEAHNYRLLLLQNAFNPDYIFYGFPEIIFENNNIYNDHKLKNKQTWRDYSLIVPRTNKTWEFRASCVQENLEKLYELITVRANLVTAINDKLVNVDTLTKMATREYFLTAIRSLTDAKLKQYIRELESSGVFDILCDHQGLDMLINNLIKTQNL